MRAFLFARLSGNLCARAPRLASAAASIRSREGVSNSVAVSRSISRIRAAEITGCIFWMITDAGKTGAAEGRRQKAGGRRQKAGGRRQEQDQEQEQEQEQD